MATITERTGSWIRRFHPATDAAVRLVCLPHAGGASTFYFPMSRALAPQRIDVTAVQYPGRQDRRTEPLIDDIGRLADAVAAHLGDLDPLPTAFFGHSMGATLAYETARRLEADGRDVLGVFASGRRAPSRSREESVHLRDDDGLVAAIRELSGTDSEVLGNEELLRMVLPAVRNDYRAVETYRHRPGPELRCPIQVLVGDEDPVTTIIEAADWSRHTTGALEMEVFAGGHFYLAANHDGVLRVVARRLAEWSAGAGPDST